MWAEGYGSNFSVNLEVCYRSDGLPVFISASQPSDGQKLLLSKNYNAFTDTFWVAQNTREKNISLDCDMIEQYYQLNIASPFRNSVLFFFDGILPANNQLGTIFWSWTWQHGWLMQRALLHLFSANVMASSDQISFLKTYNFHCKKWYS